MKGILMDRTKQMRGYLRSYLAERMQEKVKMMDKVQADDLILLASGLLQKALICQREGSSWKPSCMCLLQLLSGLGTDIPTYQLLLTDQQVYLDDRQLIDLWHPRFLYDSTEERALLKKRLCTDFPRLNGYELAYMCHWVFYGYRKLMEVYWREQAAKLSVLEEFQELDKDIPFYFLFGDYMGELKITLQYGGEMIK